ncbi:achaete-scute homolog 4-like [Pelodytes ibericus]
MDTSTQDVFIERTPLHSMTIPWGFHMDHGDTTLLDPYGISFCFDASASWDRRYSGHFSYLPFQSHLRLCDYSLEPAFIRKRNERERQRVRCVNDGYAQLRQHLPQDMAEKRLSKVETLRAAISYIKRLQGLLDLAGSPGYETLTENSRHSILHERTDGGSQGKRGNSSTNAFCDIEHNSQIP